MGLVYAEIELGNARQDELRPVTVRALVDSGAVHLCIPREVALQLNLEAVDRRTVTFADGRSEFVDYVGPVRVKFENRQCLVGALVTGGGALLGAIPMEDMDLVVHPAKMSVTVNPAHPNIPGALAMGSRMQCND
jgi:clan AA aspartic protease